MMGRVDDALSRVQHTLDSADGMVSSADRIAQALLMAEILHLDGRDSEALAVFEGRVDPMVDDLPEDSRAAALDNRNYVMMAVLAPNSASDFYALVDERRLLGLDMWGERDMLSADDAAADDKHYEALPRYWRRLARAYWQECWRAYQWASRRMARECLYLGWLREAAHHAVVAQDEKTVEAVGDALLASRDSDMIARAVQTLMLSANLDRHAAFALVLIGRIADVVPQRLMSAVSRWVTRHCGRVPRSVMHSSSLQNAFIAAKALAPRLTCRQAERIVDVAVAQECWGAGSMVRRCLIEAVSECVPHLSPERLAQLARQCVSLVTDAKADIDYVNALSLLCVIANHCDVATRAVLADALYPSGSSTVPSVLLQVCDVFGREVGTGVQLSAWAEEIAGDLALQVQHLGVDDEPQVVGGGFGTMQWTRGREKVVVQINGSSRELAALLSHRRLLSHESVCKLLNAGLGMIAEDDNVLGNKAMLAYHLAGFSDCMPDELLKTAFAVLSPLAAGNVHEPCNVMGASQASNPLNPFKMNMGTPTEVHGLALYALASIEEERAAYGDRLGLLLNKSMVHSDPSVRMWAFRAVRQMHRSSQSASTAVLMGTRDSDPIAAEWAFSVIAHKREITFTASEWEALILSLTMAHASPHVNLRRTAAYTVASLLEKSPAPSVSKRLVALKRALAKDVCYSVRESLKRA